MSPVRELTCSCGAPVNEVHDRVSGRTIRVERHASVRGEGRYRVIDFDAQPWVAEPVLSGADVMAYAAHDPNCPSAR